MLKKITKPVLLTLSENLEEKIQIEATNEKRSRHGQIIFILEKYFAPTTLRKAKSGVSFSRK